VRRRQVLDLVLHGQASETALRELAEEVRDRLMSEAGISQVDVTGVRSVEVHVEVPERTLRLHGLTPEAVAARIRAASVELPAGRVEAVGGEVLLRVTDRRDWAREFARIPIVATPGGGVLRLEDLAVVTEGFAEHPVREARFNGEPSVGLAVYRVGDQTPIGVSDATKAAMERLEPDLPDAVRWSVLNDRADSYRQRLDLLLRNAAIGLTLVLLILGLFLELKLAFWVMMGIPISFLGGLILLGWLDVSINMISMFAFIIALGIVVDDAIVAGENIYEYRQRGMSFLEAAGRGARDVAGPITLSILTNVVAFLPLYFIPGVMGQIWKVVPLVVVTVFVISWVESLLILPSHLAHARPGARYGPLRRVRDGINRGVAWFVERLFGPVLGFLLRWRGVVVALAVAMLVVALGYIAGGRVSLILMTRIEADQSVATAVLPFGAAPARVREVERLLVETAQQVARKHGGERLLFGVRSVIEENEVQVFALLTPPEERPVSTTQLTELWRRAVGPVVGVEQLKFESDRGGPGSGAALTIELSHRDIATLERAAERLAERLAEFTETKDIDDGHSLGKPQLDFRLRPAGESLGLSSAELGRQLRGAFYGAEALRAQRGRDEIKVLVRRPEAERTSEHDVEGLLVAAPAGTHVPLRQAAATERGRSYTEIRRRDARRTVAVTADVSPIAQTPRIQRALEETTLPELLRDHPGLTWHYEGRQAEMQESLSALWGGFLISLVVMYAMLAMFFRSYGLPLLVMLAIPFGIIGAAIGHLLMGYDVSLISLMGIVALAGVVVNDSLVLIEYAGRRRRDGLSALAAIRDAGVRRFRPVILTTATTFGGLAPMIFETSRQAKFMIPMAISLGFGIVFATVITLVIVPCLYLVGDDLVRSARWVRCRVAALLGLPAVDEPAAPPAA
ncbi:MAG: efflux RND transporter permease subunit, partial [Deltaproteobacteria bacterium]|nr:efflux RND transporter permease subunit [Deltaproteobacteria bacterium]